jgi:hypothetical protein
VQPTSRGSVRLASDNFQDAAVIDGNYLATDHDLLMDSSRDLVRPAAVKGLTLPEPVFPQYPEKLVDPGPEITPQKRDWSLSHVYRAMRGWLFPYIRSRVLPGEFHPITAYLFVEYKCNLDCWCCWAYNNKVKGMTEDVARRSVDWLYDHGCRVLALMGGEPLLRPQFAHKVVYYAAKKGFWIYIGTNGRLLRPDVADRLGDAGASVFNFAVDSWDEKPSLPKAVVPVRNHLEHLLKKQYVYGYMVFFQHEHLSEQYAGYSTTYRVCARPPHCNRLSHQ